MSDSQLRVKFLVAGGILGASLLGASSVGCQSSGVTQSNSPFAQYNGAPMPNGQGGPGGPGGQQMTSFGGQPQGPGAMAGYSQQNQQAFMAETQRLGTQQNLTPQDVVAMSRSGVPDAQIAIAVQQRGANLRSTPGVDQYLTQNGVNPVVLNGPSPVTRPYGGFAGQPGVQTASTMQPTPFGQSTTPTPFGMNPGLQASATGASAGDGGVQSAAYQMSSANPGFDGSAAAGAPGAGGQTWRPMAH